MGGIYNKSRRRLLADGFELADSVLSRTRGLMFRRDLKRPLLFVFGGNGRRRYAIHSLFVFFSFSAIFLDGRKRVVDARVAEPFISLMMPKAECRYLIEGKPELAAGVSEGDVLEFEVK